uniref:Cation channel sperm associated auxiliary subunit delta n=1 Tax=Molossus molossus TaxID=27622 RepID=A0A7J8I444_MOLMO|nr:cation channel sperm associated auxiliary subunit delta [Molossus molossus]
MYIIDMNSELELTALMIPRPGTSPVPLATVSNPHSLGLQAIIYEDGYTYEGNTKYRLNISLRQQHLWGRTDPNFTSSIKRPTISTITVDIANKEISCVDLKPLTALISVGCDLTKKIIIQNEISACYKGFLDPVALQDNYSYVIEKEAYDPNFRGQPATKDLVVHYPYEKLGCPLLVYYNTPWKPVMELWREGKFQEIVEAEFVLLEVNGLFTYTYSLTAGTALCISQPQNWTTILENAGDKGPFAWDRELLLAGDHLQCLCVWGTPTDLHPTGDHHHRAHAGDPAVRVAGLHDSHTATHGEGPRVQRVLGQSVQKV